MSKSLGFFHFIKPFIYLYLSFQIDGITVGSLDDVPSGPVTTFFKSIRDTLDFDFVDENEGWFYKLEHYHCAS